MAASTFKQAPIKRLAELLQEQQEPYILDMCISKRFVKNRLAELLQEQQEPYILDMCISKRFVKKSITECGDSINQNDFGESLKGSCICNPMKRIRPPKSSRILKLITNKLISYRKCSIHFNRNSRAQTEESTKNHQLIKRTNSFSYSESSAEDNFHCYSALERTFGALQAQNSEFEQAIKTKYQCGSMKGSKQIILRLQQSPVASPLYKDMECSFITRKEAEALSSDSPSMPIKATENSTISNTPCNLPSLIKKQKFYSTPDSWDIMSGFSAYVKDGTVLIQTSKLLLDYANEAINIRGKKGSGNSTREMLVPDGLREIIYKQICLWRKQPGDHKKITQLINSDLSTTLKEWSDFQQLNRDTEMVIGDSILDDIVTELINLI